MANLSPAVVSSHFQTSQANCQVKACPLLCTETGDAVHSSVRSMGRLLALSWSKGREGVKAWEVFEGDSVRGSVAGQLGQAAVWFPLPWREDLLWAWQHLPWCVSAVIPFQLDSDICWTIWEPCGQQPVCIVRWSLQVTACCEARMKSLEGTNTDYAHPHTLPASLSPFLFVFPASDMQCAGFIFLVSLSSPLPFYVFPLPWFYPLCLVWGHRGNYFKPGVF